MNEMSDWSDEERPFRFDIRRKGRQWTTKEIESKWRQAHAAVPQRLELIEGKIFLSDEQRITMLGWMLEQLGADIAVRMRDPELWRGAVEDMLRGKNRRIKYARRRRADRREAFVR